MALTDPPPGQDTGLGYDDMPAGNGWRQPAGAHPTGLLGRIARACHRHRWLTLGRGRRVPDRHLGAVRRAARQQPHLHRRGDQADQPALPAPVR